MISRYTAVWNHSISCNTLIVCQDPEYAIEKDMFISPYCSFSYFCSINILEGLKKDIKFIAALSNYDNKDKHVIGCGKLSCKIKISFDSQSQV